MLRTNLSTRPFYNERAVRATLGALALLALGLSVYNAAEMAALTRERASLSASAGAAERRAAELRREGERLRAAVDRAEVEALQSAATEANLLIDRRTFSWTGLFNQLEATLPDEVRITSITPQADGAGRLMLAVVVVSRRVEDLDTFIRRLEGTGAFRAVLTRQEEVAADGLRRSVIQGYYGATAAGPALTSDPPEEGPAEAAPRAEGEGS
jgi:Tfp pilus assembly protein PilN